MNIAALFADWSIEPTIALGLVVAALLYGLGLGYATRRGLAPHHRWWHTLSFYAGLLVILVALGGPLEALADRLFWVHMLQHELLMMAAAPLLLFGAPLMPMWRALPLGARRASLVWALQSGWPRRAWGALARFFGAPRVAWAAFTVVFLVWHLPSLYDLALRSQAVHALEHALFLGTALLFWAQVIPSLPLHRRLPYMGQAIYLGTSAMVMNVLAAVYMYSTQPLYPYYAGLARAAGSLTVLEDQHVAGAAMDVPGTLLFFGAIIGLVILWLREDERAPADTGIRPSAGRWTEGTR